MLILILSFSPNAVRMLEADLPDFFVHFKCNLNLISPDFATPGRSRWEWETEERDREASETEREQLAGGSLPLSSSAGAVSWCRQSGYKQKVFSPLTSSTGPSVGRRQRNAYSPGVTATVCHQSVRLTVLPANNASTRAQLRFITEGEKTPKQQAWWNIHISTESHLILMSDLIGWITQRGEKMQSQHLKISAVHRKEYVPLVYH